MTKITLNNVVNLQDAVTAANTINANSATIATASDNTLSRDGTSPNQMQAPLDMNSNRILNLPAPVGNTEPVRLVDLTGAILGTGAAFTGTGAIVKTSSPVITTPTGIVKGDVGLGNVVNIDTTNATNVTTGTLSNSRLSTVDIPHGGTGQVTATASFDALSPMTTRGDMIYRGASGNARLAAGTAGFFLQSNGPGTDPTWGAGGGAGGAFDAIAPTTTQGDIIYRNATTNTRLAAGTSGFHLQTNGAAANPSFAGFLQPGTGGVTRTWQAKAADVYGVKDFGAVGDGTTDDTAAFQAAVLAANAAGGGTVRVPNGTFKITGTINLADNVALVGEGSGQSVLTTATTTLCFISVNGFYNTVRGLKFVYSATPTGGGPTIAVTASAFSYTLEDIFIFNCWNGIVMQGTSNANTLQIGFLHSIKVYNYQSFGIYMRFVNDVFLTNFLIFQKDIAFTTGTYALSMHDKCEAVTITNGDMVGGSFSLKMDAASNTDGTRPQSNSFSNCYFDTTINGSQLDACAATTFVNCWFSTGGLGGNTAASSMTMNTSDRVAFTNCRFVTAPTHGCLVNAGATRTTFHACQFVDNCVTATAGTGNGLALANNVNGVEVTGGIATKASLGNQGFGISMGSGCTNITISGVNVIGNTVGSISAGSGSSANVSFRDCKGFVTENYGVTTISSGSPSAVVAHGLAATPQTVVCTLQDNGTGAQAVGANLPRVLSIGSANFTFDIGVVTAANKAFYWYARF